MRSRAEEIRSVIRQHEDILRPPFIGAVAQEALVQIPKAAPITLEVYSGTQKIQLEGFSVILSDAIEQISAALHAGLHSKFMAQVIAHTDIRQEDNIINVQAVGEQISDTDRLGTQRACKLVLDAAEQVISRRHWSAQPNDLEVFKESLPRWFRVIYPNYAFSSSLYLTLADYNKLIPTHPEGQRYQPAVNCAARFKGTTFEEVRMVQFAAETGLLCTKTPGYSTLEKACIGINLSMLPELTAGIDKQDLLDNPAKYPHYFEATTEVTAQLLVQMGFRKSDDLPLDLNSDIPFVSRGTSFRHPTEPKLYAQAWVNYPHDGDIYPASKHQHYNFIEVRYIFD